jgi:hypothetical protein
MSTEMKRSMVAVGTVLLTLSTIGGVAVWSEGERLACVMGTRWDAPLFPEGAVAMPADPAGTSWCRTLNGVRACVPRSPRIVQENRRPGSAAWCISPSAGADVEGFASKASAQTGDMVTLFVSTRAPTFHVEAYRLGFYGGLGGRLVWHSAEIRGHRRATPPPDPVTNLVQTRWSPSLSFRVTGEWTPGVYLLKLVGSEGSQSYVPLVVRDDWSRSALLLQIPVATWQAYNTWGGHSLYYGPGKVFDDRARVVSFDRPYVRNRGAADLLQGGDQPLIALVERLGLDVAYWTDLDLHERGVLLPNHRALVVVGHGEYWSTAMRDAVERGRRGGVNLFFVEANDAFRHIRIEPSPLGFDRHVVAYKDAAEDPLTGVNNPEVTVDWRQPPVSRPESELLGAAFECGQVFADMVVTDASTWPFSGTDLRDGDRLPDLVGFAEVDRVDPSLPTPRHLQVLAHSPGACRGRHTYSDMTYYAARSGAGVLDTGTTAWAYRLGLPCILSDRCGAAAQFVRSVTENVLAAFGSGPAGPRFASVSNLKALGIELQHPIDP